MDGWDWLIAVVKTLAVLAAFLSAPIVMVLAERRILGRLQSRIGPNRVGPWGLLQSAVDGLKLAGKEDLIPRGADKPLFWIAPLLLVVPAMGAWAVVPFGPPVEIGREVTLWAADLNVGVLFFLAMGSMAVYGSVVAGWASNSKYAHFGALRASAQIISYELVMGLAVLGVLIHAGTMSLPEIVSRQRDLWFIVPQFVGFILFVIAGVAETNRTPFDLGEAESELIAGYNLEYGSVKFAMFMAAEYVAMIVISAFAATLFLGGPNGPFLPGFVWLGIKIAVLLFIFIWVRATLPRFRYDRLMKFGWKVLIPVAMANVMVTAVVVGLGFAN